jgi:hypothetical protein
VRATEQRIAGAENIFRAAKAVDINTRRQEWEEDIVPLNAAPVESEYHASPQ